jgi:hypothetical protein
MGTRVALCLLLAGARVESTVADTLDSAAETTDYADRERWPLIFAAGEGDVEQVRSLLKSGVDVGQLSKDGESAL